MIMMVNRVDQYELSMVENWCLNQRSQLVITVDNMMDNDEWIVNND